MKGAPMEKKELLKKLRIRLGAINNCGANSCRVCNDHVAVALQYITGIETMLESAPAEAAPTASDARDEMLLNTAAYAEVKSIEDLDWDYDHSLAEAFKRGSKWSAQLAVNKKALEEAQKESTSRLLAWEAAKEELRLLRDTDF